MNNLLDKPRLRFCLRVTVTALLALGLAHVAAVPLHGLWAVPTAVLVMQMSIGGSLKAATDYVIGTIGGAAYAAAIAALVPHPTVLSFAGVLVLAVAPLAYAAAFSASFRVALVTAILVLMPRRYRALVSFAGAGAEQPPPCLEVGKPVCFQRARRHAQRPVMPRADAFGRLPL